jgi:holo-[acyl-carrier protein] synthase
MQPAHGLRCGIDVVDLARFRRLVTLRGQTLLRIVFSESEIVECGDRIERLAARFAAKEATAKALGCGIGGEAGVGWREIETLSDGAGAPSLRLSGRAAYLAAQRGLERWSISLSQSRAVALALVVAER